MALLCVQTRAQFVGFLAVAGSPETPYQPQTETFERDREGRGAEVKKASSQMGCQGLAWRAANTHVRLMHSSTNALWIEGGLARAILGVKVKLINAKGIRERFCCKRQICHPRQHHLRSAATKGARESSAFPRPPPTGTTQKHTDTYVAHAV